MDPAKKAELATQLRTLQVRDERDEACPASARVAAARRTDHVESERDESVVLRKRERRGQEGRLEREDVLEVVDERFAV